MTSAYIRLEQAQPRGGEDCAAECCECFEEGADIGCLLSAWDGWAHNLDTVHGWSVKLVVSPSWCHLFRRMSWIVFLVETREKVNQ